MLKSLALPTVISLVFISSMAQVATSYPASRSRQSGIFLDEGNTSQPSYPNVRYSPQSSNTNYPTVPLADVGQLICYMEMADGRVLNLNRMCQRSKPSSTQTLGSTNTSIFRNSPIGGGATGFEESSTPDAGYRVP